MADAIDDVTEIPAGGAPQGGALERLLEHVIDYAGLFPPAKLDMAPVVANYARYVASPESWMLERLIVPVARLAEFEEVAAAHLPTGGDDEPWPISCIVRPAADEGIEEDFAAIEAFNERHAEPPSGLAIVDVVELKGADAAAIDRVLDVIPDELFPFFEMDPAADLRGALATLVGGDAGAKIRTGGLEPAAFPAPEHVASFIVQCARADVPFKATAGLHHPLRHRDATVGCDAFGFLNVFGAAVLARRHDLDAEEVERILVERSTDAITFGPEGLAWRDGDATYDVTTDEIEDARLAFAVSYGSCSFVEPIEDLRALGLL